MSGLGTFRPVKEDEIDRPRDAQRILRDLAGDGGSHQPHQGERRARASAWAPPPAARWKSWAAEDGTHGRPRPAGRTSIIYPGYRFKVMDALVTNFHLPESTLIMLVSALAGREHVLACLLRRRCANATASSASATRCLSLDAYESYMHCIYDCDILYIQNVRNKLCSRSSNTKARPGAANSNAPTAARCRRRFS